MAGVKKLRVNVTVPEGFAPGDTFVIEVEVPSARGRQRTVKPIDEMTQEELKREIINAGSVLYKAQKRGADEEIIERNKARLEAAKALMDEKYPRQARKKGPKGSVILQADARILTQDELDHPERYMDDDESYVPDNSEYADVENAEI